MKYNIKTKEILKNLYVIFLILVNDDDVDLTNREVNLIKLYMNMYEFGQLDTETQKFLICIFEVGSWYVHNVYTQLGGQKTAMEVDDIAEISASEGAYNKWRNYLDWYGKHYNFETKKKILPVVYDYERKEYTDMVAYKCELFKNASYGKGNNIYSKTGMQILKNSEGEEIFREWKNYCVIDDSSKFAAAVYYHYINKEILRDENSDNRIAYGIDLWETNSVLLTQDNSNIINQLVIKSKKFEVFNEKRIKKYKSINGNSKTMNLKAGDLICRLPNYERGTDGLVEFYIGNDKVVGWGTINKQYFINKEIIEKDNKFYIINSNYEEEPYTCIIRFKGDDKDEK